MDSEIKECVVGFLSMKYKYMRLDEINSPEYIVDEL